MSNPDVLTLGFLEFHPEAAADAIEDLEAAEAAALLANVPARVCAPVLTNAAPWAAAAWIEQMPPVHAAAILQAMSYQEATTALRLVSEQNREKVLNDLPAASARSFRRSLSYPSGTVGAWMDQSVPTFDQEATVADGMKYLKSRRRRPVLPLIIVGPRKSFAGVVSATDLLRSAPNAPISGIQDDSIEPLSNRALLASVMDDAAWDDYPAIPVVGRKGNVLGSLTRSGLKKGLMSGDGAPDSIPANSVLAHLVAGYFTVLSGLLRTLAEPGIHKSPRVK